MHASHPPLHARADVVGFPSFSQLELLVEQRTRRRRHVEHAVLKCENIAMAQDLYGDLRAGVGDP